jgi:hypothetical protein
MTQVLTRQQVRPTSLDDLANYISGTGTRNRKRQLPYSSIDDASLTLKTGGVISGFVGTQWDGTTGVSVVNGPKPPRPAQARVITTPGGITVRWDGTFDPATWVTPDGVVTPVFAPGDFKGVEIQVSETSFSGTFADVRGPLLTSARGGDVFIPWENADTRVYVRLVVRATTGKASDPGPVAEGTTGTATGAQAAVDTVPPAKVTGLQLATYTALDATGTDQGYVVAIWAETAQNADQSMMTDLSHYQINWRWTGRGGDQWQSTTSTEPGVQLAATTGLDYDVRVRAVDRGGLAGEWSDTWRIRVAEDTTPPQPPQAPEVTNYMGQLRIRWSGWMQDLGDPPPDFNYVEVHVGNAPDFSPVQGTKVSQLVAAGEAYAYAPYGQTRYVRLYAFDKSGNRSQSSVVIAGSTSKVVSDDILAGAVGSLQLANLAVRSANIDVGAVNSLHVSELNVGRLTGGILNAPVILGGSIGTAATGARIVFDSVGLRGFRENGSRWMNITPFESLLTGTFMTAETGRRITIGAGGTTGVIDFFAPDKAHAFIRGYTERSGVESLQLKVDAPSGDNFLWNSININSIGITSYQAVRHIMSFPNTGEWAVESFPDQTVYDPVNPVAHGGVRRVSVQTEFMDMRDRADTLRFHYDMVGMYLARPDGREFFQQLTGNVVRIHPSGVSGEGYVEFQHNSGNTAFSPKIILYQGNGGGLNLKSASGWLEVKNLADSAFLPIRAASIEQTSDRSIKKAITDTALDGMAAVKAMRIRDYSVTRPKRNGTGDEEVDVIGVVAQELQSAGIPIVTPPAGDGTLGVDLGQWIAVVAKGLQELAARVEALEARPGRGPA